MKSGTKAMSPLAGPVGGKVALKARRGSEEMDFYLERVSLGAMSVRAERVRPGVLRVAIPTLEGTGIARRVERLLAAFEVASQTILLDLRDNPGGRIEETNAIADIFLDGKLLEILELRDGRRIAFRAKAGAIRSSVLVLVNHNSGSGAEVLAMALRDNAAAVIVGERTAGALFGKDLETLEDGRALIIRREPLVLSPTGKDYSRGGIPPDIEVPDRRDGRDEILERAIDAVEEGHVRPASEM